MTTDIKPSDEAVGTQRGPSRRRTLLDLLSGGPVPRMAFLFVFGAAFLLFSIAETTTFLSLDNARFLVRQAALGAVLALALTLVVTLKEFDIAGPGIIGVAAAVSVYLLVTSGWGVIPAILVAMAAATAFGALNGILISKVALPSVVCTLATGALAHAVEYGITGRSPIIGAPPEFRLLGGGRLIWIIEAPLIIAVLAALAIWFGLERSDFGRRVRAAGDNPVAAYLSGIDIRRLRFWVFLITGAAAGVTGIVVAANSGAYSPDPGAGYFISTYAAVFLGGAVGRQGRFNVPGTLLGLIFLAMLRNGFGLMGLPTWLADIVSGSIIMLGGVMSRVGSGGSGMEVARH
jgi:ribose/xylose/arabinose/galactoside ABC-type transport system permease subunit